MSFKSLNHILGALEEQARWQGAAISTLTKCWPNVVGAAVTAQTQPVSIQRGILSVATSSAALGTNADLERHRILCEKLNVHLPSPLVDIRFSWLSGASKDSYKLEIRQQRIQARASQPCGCVSCNPRLVKRLTPNNPNAAFGHWASDASASAWLPLSQCHCPTLRANFNAGQMFNLVS